MRVALVPILSTLIVPLGLHAQDDGDPRDTLLVISADRQERPIERTTAAVSVVTRDDRHDRGYHENPLDDLRGLPGVHITQYGGLAGIADVRIRGMKTTDTQVLLDGIPFDDPTAIGNAPRVAWLSWADVERIEVVRGPQSGLYGSKAGGGVIDVRSNRPTDTLGGSARLSAGSHETYAASASAQGPLGHGVGFSFGADVLDTGGWSAQVPPGANGDGDAAEADGMTRYGANGRLEWKAGTGTVYVATRAAGGTADLDDSDPNTFAPRPDNRAEQTQRLWRLGIGGNVALHETLRVGADVARTTSQTAYPDAESSFFGPSTSKLVGEQWYAEAQLAWQAQSWLQFSGGTDARFGQAEITDTTGAQPIDENDRILGFWAQSLAGRQDHYELSLALRRDEHSEAGAANTWKLGGLYGVVPGIFAVRGAYGTAFRAPSLYELHDPASGNPDLEAQESSGWDVGFRVTAGSIVHWEETYFTTRYDRIITFNPAPPFNTINGGEGATIEGFEHALELFGGPQHPLWLRAALTNQVAENPNGSPLSGTPNHVSSLWGGLRLPRWWCSVGVDQVGTRYEYDDSLGFVVLVEPITTFGAAAGYFPQPWLECYLRADDIADAHDPVVPNYGVAGRTITGGVTATW